MTENKMPYLLIALKAVDNARLAKTQDSAIVFLKQAYEAYSEHSNVNKDVCARILTTLQALQKNQYNLDKALSIKDKQRILAIYDMMDKISRTLTQDTMRPTSNLIFSFQSYAQELIELSCKNELSFPEILHEISRLPSLNAATLGVGMSYLIGKQHPSFIEKLISAHQTLTELQEALYKSALDNDTESPSAPYNHAEFMSLQCIQGISTLWMQGRSTTVIDTFDQLCPLNAFIMAIRVFDELQKIELESACSFAVELYISREVVVF